MTAPVFMPFACYNCWEHVRGDTDVCPTCNAPLHVSAFTRGEQRAEDLERAGLCPNCERAIGLCDAEPCVVGEE